MPRPAAGQSALRHFVETFFDGSAEQAVATMLGGEVRRLSESELDRIARMVAKARTAQRAGGRPGGESPENGSDMRDATRKGDESR